MIPVAEQIKEDLAYFADLGSGVPRAHETSATLSVEMVRFGQKILIRMDKSDGRINCIGLKDGGSSFVSFKSLLASEYFANLRAWAAVQSQVLREVIEQDTILLDGHFRSDDINETIDVEQFDNILAQQTGAKVTVYLIDGPAGIGKTKIIERIAFSRAANIMKTQRPLILHVRSRGRVLTYLQDLMAFSLQSMRLQVTYDQVPVLVRHGLVQLAIDGFDELGDPNGYETAWAQVRELIEAVEGEGCLILSGRETFISRDRLIAAVPRLELSQNRVSVFSVLPVAPQKARQWIRLRVGEELVQVAEKWGFFEDGSYALRPVFLSHIVDILNKKDSLKAGPPLLLLVDALLNREADEKLPDVVTSVWSSEQRRAFISKVMEETARDMADNQTDSIDDEMLVWIVDAVLGDDPPVEISNILKNRVQAVAFLQRDERGEKRRFAHSEFYNLFLASGTMDTIIRNEVPKYIRRNIIGLDFLIVFGTVIEMQKGDKIRNFGAALKKTLDTLSGIDRSERNLGALTLACLPAADEINIDKLVNVDVDDAVSRGVSKSFCVNSCTINQLDARGSDLSEVKFERSVIAFMLADETTRVSETFPSVGWLQISWRGNEQILSGEKAEAWLDRHGRSNLPQSFDVLVSPPTRGQPIYILLQRVCRVMLRQYWIRSDGEDPATKLTRHLDWSALINILRDNDLLEERTDKPASGPQSTFFHVSHARALLSEETDNVSVVGVLKDIEAFVKKT